MAYMHVTTNVWSIPLVCQEYTHMGKIKLAPMYTKVQTLVVALHYGIAQVLRNKAGGK